MRCEMTNIDGMLKREIKASDAVVDGLFRGALAGLGMSVYLALAGLAYGESPLGVLGRFDPAAGGQPLVGLLAHLAGPPGRWVGFPACCCSRSPGSCCCRVWVPPCWAATGARRPRTAAGR